MARDMSSIYAQMLTKDLVALRAWHLLKIRVKADDAARRARAEVARRRELVQQIEHELACRVVDFNLFV